MASPRPRNVGHIQERYRMPFDFPAVAADTTFKVDSCKGRSIRIDRVWLSLPAGLTANAANFVVIKLIKGASTVIASWSTSTGITGQGAIAVNTPVDLVLASSRADRHLADGDTLSLFLDVTGTPTVPLGRIVVDGYEL